MSRGPNFVERDVFNALLTEVQRLDGGQYEDVSTAYGDMSRLVVAWLARTSPERLKELYNEFGWQSTANSLQFHLAARTWFEKYHPERAVPWNPEQH